MSAQPSDLGEPPARPVRWTLTHRDGTAKVVVAQTAARAASAAGWTMSEVALFQREGEP